MKKFTMLFSTLCILSTSFICAKTEVVSLENPTIPVLDMQDYFNPETKQKFLNQMTEAFKSLGFLAVVNTDVSKTIIDDAYDASKEFFAYPMETKLKYDSRPVNCQRGYLQPFIEKAKNAKQSNFNELFHVGRPLSYQDHLKYGYALNKWPEEFDMETPVMKLYNELEKYMIPLQRAMAECLSQEIDIFHEMTKDGDCMLRISHYPSMEKKLLDEGYVWAGAHTDIDLFTLLPRATAKGLEVQDRDGNWVRVVVPEDAFIVNAGDMLENVSNGYFRSAVHRVVSGPDNEEGDRYSMVFFVHPKNSDDLEPKAHCIELTGGKQQYAKATRWELLMERLADIRFASDPMLEELAESKFIERLIEFDRDSIDAMKYLRDKGLASDKILERIVQRESSES